MKKYLLAMLAIVGLLFVTSCSEDDTEDATLTLSKNVVEFEKGGAEESITVTTDVEKWSAMGSADWIEVTQNGSSLVVKVQPNETVYDRKGKVLVVAGNTNGTIDVMQKGLKGSAVILPEKINVEDAKGEFTVEVNANDKNWSAESDSEWLQVTAKPYKAEMILNYEKNSTPNDRTAIVTLTVGNDKTQVEVKQLGIMFFLLPYMDLANGTRDQIIAFEQERKNKIDEQRTIESRISVRTRSTKMFPMLDYELTDDGSVIKATMLPKSVDLMQKNLEDFQQFLKNSGFKQEGVLFINEKESITAQVVIAQNWFGTTARVEFKPIPKQDKDYPTFTQFPYGFTEWGVKKDKIDEYESKEGGIYNEESSVIDNPKEKSDFLWYDVKEDKQGEGETESRAYFIDKADQPKPGLRQAVQVMKKTTLVFFTANGEAVLTKEFKALCKKEGFSYQGFGNEYHFFKNADKKLVVAVKYGVLPGQDTPSLLVNVGAVPEEESSLKSFDAYEKFFEKCIKKNQK